MVFQIQKLSSYGTSSPAVARTLVQGTEILKYFNSPEAQREEAKIILAELQRHLVRSTEIRDQIEKDVTSAHEEIKNKGFEFQSSGQVVTLPSVVDLHSKAESFLQSAKFAIRETAHLVTPFYGQSFDHRFDTLAAWSEKQFGKDDAFTQVIRLRETGARRIVDMRNAVEHPHDEPGQKLNTRNFTLAGTPDAPILVEPTWNLLGEPEVPLLPELTAIITYIIVVGEEILTVLFDKLKDNASLRIYEIPAEQRNPACPIRMYVGML